MVSDGLVKLVDKISKEDKSGAIAEIDGVYEIAYGKSGFSCPGWTNEGNIFFFLKVAFRVVDFEALPSIELWLAVKGVSLHDVEIGEISMLEPALTRAFTLYFIFFGQDLFEEFCVAWFLFVRIINDLIPSGEEGFEFEIFKLF